MHPRKSDNFVALGIFLLRCFFRASGAHTHYECSLREQNYSSVVVAHQAIRTHETMTAIVIISTACSTGIME